MAQMMAHCYCIDMLVGSKLNCKYQTCFLRSPLYSNMNMLVEEDTLSYLGILVLHHMVPVDHWRYIDREVEIRYYCKYPSYRSIPKCRGRNMEAVLDILVE